jgi:methylphosphotriester-DNA--protein-cysteine methyltransferase
MPKLYRIQKNGQTILSPKKGKFAGCKVGKIFGRLDCKSGMRMKKENRVFFHTVEDAIAQGYRPCKLCEPLASWLWNVYCLTATEEMIERGILPKSLKNLPDYRSRKNLYKPQKRKKKS